MAKFRRSPQQEQFEAFAKRRAGATYISAAVAIKDRLLELGREFADVPKSYQGYLLVGICTCLESHLKYSYAYAAERFANHPEILRTLFKDIQVDVDTLISTSVRSFQLADVVAASISVSSLDTYLRLASAFFTAFDGKPHDFPWDLNKVFGFGDHEDGKKSMAQTLDRLRRVFAARHNFVHETLPMTDALRDDPALYVDDAIQLFNLFDKHLENIEMSPGFSAINQDEGLIDAVERQSNEVDAAFEEIKTQCHKRQFEALDNFKRAFIGYVEARCDFEATVFIAQRSEASMSNYLDLVPQYRSTLKEIALKQKHLHQQYPYEAQLKDMGINPEDLSDA